jgi:hypothetical protein
MKESLMRAWVLIAAAAMLTLADAGRAAAQELVVNVGPPVAAAGQPTKFNVFVVRPGGCANPGAAQFTGTVEGIVGGSRLQVPLQLTALPTPGVHAVRQTWPAGGRWVVSLAARCDGRTAGAIVAVAAEGQFRRENVTLLAHAPTPQEVESSLRSIAAR